MNESIANIIYNIIDKKGKIYYKNIREELDKNGFSVSDQIVNATLSQDPRFESNNRGFWIIIGRGSRDKEIKKYVDDIFLENRKPFLASEITSILIGRGLLNIDEEFLPRRVLLGNSFIRWGTSDYWGMYSEDFPGVNVGEFYKKNIEYYFSMNKAPINRKDLAFQIQKFTKISIKHDGGFSSEISRLIKSKNLKSLKNSVIAPIESTVKIPHLKLKDMVNRVFIAEKKQMSLSEIRYNLENIFSIKVKTTSLSAALVEDERFILKDRKYWSLKNLQLSPRKKISKMTKSNEQLLSKIPSHAISKGILKLTDSIDDFFPDFNCQIIFKIKEKKFLVNYNKDDKKLENLKELFAFLDFKKNQKNQKNEMLILKLEDPVLKVYSLRRLKDEEKSHFINSNKTNLLIPSLSSNDILYRLRDLMEDLTNPGDLGFVYINGLPLELCSLLSNGKRKVKIKYFDDNTSVLIKNITKTIKDKRFIITKARNWWSLKEKKFKAFSKSIYSLNIKCSDCNEYLWFLNHEVSTNTFNVVCSNADCKKSAIRRSKNIKLNSKDISEYEKKLKNKKLSDFHKYFENKINGKTLKCLLPFRTSQALNVLIKEIYKIRLDDLKQIMLYVFSKTIDEVYSKRIMYDKNVYIVFCKNLKKFLTTLRTFPAMGTFEEIQNFDFVVFKFLNSEEILKQEIFYYLYNTDSPFCKFDRFSPISEDRLSLIDSCKIFIIKDMYDEDNEEKIINYAKKNEFIFQKKIKSITDGKEIFVFDKK